MQNILITITITITTELSRYHALILINGQLKQLKLNSTDWIPVHNFDVPINSLRNTAHIRALASARGSVATRRVATGPRARRARRQRARPLEGPKGPRVAQTCESEDEQS